MSKRPVFSFDVFDTCVTRSCDRPTDLFERLFVGLLAQKQLTGYELTAAAKALARARIAAEATTRQQTIEDDITLSAIYQSLGPELEPYRLSADEAEAAEIELELATVSPILYTQQRVRQLRSQGSRVIFISDMYLPGWVVRQMLKDHGFLASDDTASDDEVYVSADVGLTKGSGRLFPYVCDQLGIAPAQLHHTGDNRYADVRAAQRQGVEATLFTQGDPTRYEQGFRAELVGDDWMRSHLVGLSRAVRLGHDTGSLHSHSHATLAADVLAPLITGYLIWVLTTAKKRGLHRLYFADAGLLSIAEAICQSGLCQMELHELVSRREPEGDAASPGYCFMLLNTVEQSAIMGDQPTQFPDSLTHTPISYIEAPLKRRKGLKGADYLFAYSSIVERLFCTLSSTEVTSYKAIVLDYVSVYLADSAKVRNLSQSSLGLLKQYAINNVIRLLREPDPSDVETIAALPSATDARPAQLRPIHTWEVPKLSKQLLKGKTSNAQGRWLEGAIALSPFPIRSAFASVKKIAELRKNS